MSRVEDGLIVAWTMLVASCGSQHGGTEAAPYNRIVDTGAFSACVYDVNARGTRTRDDAERLLTTTRERVRRGRASRPNDAHYVSVIVDGDVTEVVREGLIEKLGNGDGVDSVAVEGARVEHAPTDALAERSRREENELLSRMEAGWSRVRRAVETDTPLEATVIEVGSSEPRVEIEGAVGDLTRHPNASQLRVGDHVRVRVIALNLRTRMLVLMPQ